MVIISFAEIEIIILILKLKSILMINQRRDMNDRKTKSKVNQFSLFLILL